MALEFRKGFNKVAEHEERNKMLAEARKGQLFSFYPDKSGEDAEVFFMTEEPIVVAQHSKEINGKYTSYTCKGQFGLECEDCDDGVKKSDSYAWLIWDTRSYERKERDSNGRETGKKIKVEGSVRPIVRGVIDAAKLMKQHSKYGLMDWSYNISAGASKSAGWSIDRGTQKKVTKKMIEQWMATLPEELRNLTPEEVLERQLTPPELLKDGNKAVNKKARKQAADEEEDGLEDVDEEEEEEDEPAPKKHFEKKNNKTHKKFKFSRK